MFWNLIKITRRHVFNVNFGQDFQSSHQTKAPYGNGARNLRWRDICASEKELLHHLQLRRSKEFETSSSGAPGSQSEDLVSNFRCKAFNNRLASG